MRNKLWIIMLLAMIVAVPVLAVPVEVYSVDLPVQDPLSVRGLYHELGDGFPADELIASTDIETNYIPCPSEYDPALGPNIEVTMTNLTPTDWQDVHYVADNPITAITNFDGMIGNAGLGDAWWAFRIDNIGLNTPLVFESITPDNVFEAGETWQFVLQNFVSTGPATPLGSIGIASLSPVATLSTGSIIAQAIPEASTYLLFGLGTLGLMVWRKRKK